MDTMAGFTSNTSEKKNLLDCTEDLSDEELDEETKRRLAVEKIEKRYERTGSSLSHVEQGKRSSHGDYFIYRQPSMNRATWEVSPRPYRDDIPILSIDEIGTEEDGESGKRTSTNKKRKPSQRTIFGQLVSRDYST
jgi:hypothetical protein